MLRRGFVWLVVAAWPMAGRAGARPRRRAALLAPSKGSAPKKITDVKASDAALMSALANQPVSVAIEADQSGFQFYKSGVFSGTCGTNLDHGVLVVGYGTP